MAQSMSDGGMDGHWGHNLAMCTGGCKWNRGGGEQQGGE